MVDRRRILIFLGIAFGTAWALGLLVYLTGGLSSPLALPLVMGIMLTPAIANVSTRLLTREGWHDVRLRPRLRPGWRYWLLAWFGPPALIVLGAGVYFLVFPQHFDPALGGLVAMMPPGVEVSPWLFAAAGVIQGILLSPLVNGLLTFGEEFGWRAYLQPRLLPLGTVQAMLLMGLIWGVWHAPLVLMGHNYGLDYAATPYLGLVAMVWFTFVLGTCLGWLTERGGSVWPAVIGHAAVNGMAALPAAFTQGGPNPLIGPAITGLVGGSGFAIAAVAILLLWRGDSPGPEAQHVPGN